MEPRLSWKPQPKYYHQSGAILADSFAALPAIDRQDHRLPRAQFYFKGREIAPKACPRQKKEVGHDPVSKTIIFWSKISVRPHSPPINQRDRFPSTKRFKSQACQFCATFRKYCAACGTNILAPEVTCTRCSLVPGNGNWDRVSMVNTGKRTYPITEARTTRRGEVPCTMMLDLCQFVLQNWTIAASDPISFARVLPHIYSKLAETLYTGR